LGVPLGAPVSVTVSLDGQVQCQRCFAHNPAVGISDCRNCGGSLYETCRNPDCRTRAAAHASACPRCHLPFTKGRLYAGAIALADACLDTANAGPALAACGLAESVLPGPAVAARVSRAGLIRSLVAAVQH